MEGQGAGETTGPCTEDLNVSKNVTLTTGRAISGQQPRMKRKCSNEAEYLSLPL